MFGGFGGKDCKAYQWGCGFDNQGMGREGCCVVCICGPRIIRH